MSEQPPTSTPTVVPDESTNLGKPIPFKPRAFIETVDQTGSRPTTRADCEAAGGHGGKDGTRVYNVAVLNTRTGMLSPGPLICEICGEVDI